MKSRLRSGDPRPELTEPLGSGRFLREIHIVAGLQHPHILPLPDLGSADGVVYFVMLLVTVEPLRDRLLRQRQLRALAYAGRARPGFICFRLREPRISVTVTAVEQLRAVLADHYTLERELGRGGMATVYLAQDLKHSRPVAVKVLRPDVTEALGATQFLREIRIAARLTHPNILSVHDSGKAAGLLYYVMPYVSGDTLRERLRREGQLPLDDALRIAREVADALSYAHGEGVVHRDIKPENILFGAGHAMVADFGIAKAMSAAAGDESISNRFVLGTPTYMSPEQATGSDIVDARSDVYSLGCLLYEMLAGEPPFTGATAQVIASKHVRQPVPSLLALRPDLPRWVQTVVERAMAKLPADRFQTATAFTSALGAPEVTASMVAVDRPAGRWVWAAILGVAAVAATFVLRHRSEVTPTSSPARFGATVATPRDPTHIAVLYFDPEGPDSNLRSVANGLTEDLIDRLGEVEALSVISANGVRPFRGRPVHLDSIGSALLVGTLVSGTVGGTTAHPRITVRLIDPQSGRQLDSKLIEPGGDVLALRGELARQVAFFLRERLGEEIQLRDLQSGTQDAGAWVLVWRAQKLREDAKALFHSADPRTAQRTLETADSLLILASGRDEKWLDPRLLRAWISADRIDPDDTTGGRSVAQWVPAGLARVAEVLARKPDYPPALALRGWFRMVDWQYNGRGDQREIDSAERDLRAAAVPGNPSQAFAWGVLSALLVDRGAFEEANVAARRAYDADAFLSDAQSIVFRLYLTSLLMRQWDRASQWCAQGFSRFPERWLFSFCQLTQLYMPGPTTPDVNRGWQLVAQLDTLVPRSARPIFNARWRMMMAAVLARAGMTDSARQTLRSARQPSSRDDQLDFYEASARVRLGDKTEAISLLERYLASSPEGKAFIRRDPEFEPLWTDARFERLVAETDSSARP
jgi:TolB-like protein